MHEKERYKRHTYPYPLADILFSDLRDGTSRVAK